jgi:hypothetical protein
MHVLSYYFLIVIFTATAQMHKGEVVQCLILLTTHFYLKLKSHFYKCSEILHGTYSDKMDIC